MGYERTSPAVRDDSITMQAARSTTALAELPDKREYERSVDQPLDEALVETIDAAEAAGFQTRLGVDRKRESVRSGIERARKRLHERTDSRTVDDPPVLWL